MGGHSHNPSHDSSNVARVCTASNGGINLVWKSSALRAIPKCLSSHNHTNSIQYPNLLGWFLPSKKKKKGYILGTCIWTFTNNNRSFQVLWVSTLSWRQLMNQSFCCFGNSQDKIKVLYIFAYNHPVGMHFLILYPHSPSHISLWQNSRYFAMSPAKTVGGIKNKEWAQALPKRSTVQLQEARHYPLSLLYYVFLSFLQASLSLQHQTA